MYRSTNGGETWAQANNLPRQADTCRDPTVDWSWDGRFVHAAALGDCGFGDCEVWYYRSDDNGLDWNDPGANPIIVSAGNNNSRIAENLGSDLLRFGDRCYDSPSAAAEATSGSKTRR